MKLTPRALILCGDGLNCEYESAAAFERAGAQSTLLHINDLLSSPDKLMDYHLWCLPGGFSFGDHLGSGQVLALKLKQKLGPVLDQYLEQKRPILGICNGFQVLTKLKVFTDGAPGLGLAPNRQGHFIDESVEMTVNKETSCLWVSELLKQEKFKVTMPMRHGEGRLVLADHVVLPSPQIVLTYNQDVNGSWNNVAGICNPAGNVFGLMPHPEVAWDELLCPSPEQASSYVSLEIFKSAVHYVCGL